jgi:release factor glutamine methyltransferase
MTETIGDVLADAKQRIAPISASASLDAQLMLAHVIGENRAHIIVHPERMLTSEQAEQYEKLVARRADGEPIAYILGSRAFYDREFIVTPAVLIPRPETEHLLEMALDFVKEGHSPVTVVDVGTGSGALAITLAANAPQAIVHAIDISPDALAIAKLNAQENEVSITFHQGNLLQPLIKKEIRVDLVMANLPYIASEEVPILAVSKHEPRLALDGGPDGLDLIRELMKQVPLSVNSGGLILLEIGAEQGAETRLLVEEMEMDYKIEIHKDYAGHDRIVWISL